MSTPSPPLSQGAGYGVVVGLGALFAIGMIFISNTLSKRGNKEDNEEFTVAKRSVGTGLTAAAVISSWTWSTTLLSSCNVAYTYGVAGAFFYAACNSTQVMVFSNLAIQTKRKAPNAHTFLEIMRVRYGTFVHLSFMFFSLAANTLVVSSVLLGGSAAISALTGINIYGALWLLPASVAAYTLRGGLRATILTDYLHTAVILIVVLMFWFAVYTSGDQIGSPDKMYNLLLAAQARNNDAPTLDHSYVTIRSLGALKFAILSILEYTGVVFLDNSFHQKGIAADPASAVPGYILGGISWYAMPFTLATTMGLVAVALENTPAFPTYPRRMTAAETGAGLVLPYAAQTIMGKGGAAAVLLLMFMSCTSAISAQLIGVSTVISYDVYRTYFRKDAHDQQLLRASHYAVVGFSLWMAGFSSMLYGAGIDLNFIYNMTGIFTGAALPPLVGTFFSSRQGALAAGASVWGGFITAVIVWLSLTHRFYGAVNVTTVAELDPCLYGCLAGIASSAFITIVLSLIFPAHYNWESLAAVRVQTEHDDKVDVTFEDPSYDPEKLRKAAILARGVTLFLFLALFIIWPLSMYGDGYIFSKTFFRGWVIVSVLWAFFAIFAVTVFPVIEGRHTLVSIFLSFVPGHHDLPVVMQDLNKGEKADSSDGSLDMKEQSPQ
ncbi:Na+/solute symporter [Athelia psychrophila]|uniref:Na+/solute symporter n=1 Tax=Athelia psychrophila TaxID=1759441 RepID=A0A167UF52_9AGAM|nr:Na+/solute symporter [Fibularhizoctonia sp. CBS 109695]